MWCNRAGIPKHSPTFRIFPQHSPTFPNIPQHSATFPNIPPTFRNIPHLSATFRNIVGECLGMLRKVCFCLWMFFVYYFWSVFSFNLNENRFSCIFKVSSNGMFGAVSPVRLHVRLHVRLRVRLHVRLSRVSRFFSAGFIFWSVCKGWMRG